MISREEVLHIAGLSRLTLKEDEIASLQKDMSAILEYVGQVVSFETSAGKEATLPRNVMRADVPRANDSLLAGKENQLISAFPKEENGFNVVRKIIQKDE